MPDAIKPTVDPGARCRLRPDAETVIAFLRSSTLFEDADMQLLEEIERRLQWCSVPTRTVLFNQGDPADRFYLVMSGRLRVSLDNEAKILDEVGAGEIIGEIAVISGNPRSATVTAVRPSELLALSKSDFDELIATNPHLISVINRMILERIRLEREGRVSATGAKTITFLHADAEDHDIEWLSQLAVSLNASKRTRLLSKADFESTDLDFNELERRYELVLYNADVRDPDWVFACIPQTDLLVVVLRPDNRDFDRFLSILPDIEQLSLHREWIFIQPSSRRSPVDVQRWLQALPARNHLHIRPDLKPDVEKLARYFGGRAVGLTLGGGGARGFAHIGVIRALQELRIPIDFVGGTSMGAVIAAQLARGWTVDDMLENNHQAWVINKPLKDFTLPISSVIRGKRVRRMLQDMFGDTLMENLWMNLFCVSANLSRRALAVHNSGLLWRRVGASLSIPGFGPPCIIDGELHVDGALVNNLPVDVMKNLYGCRVVAVDVSQNAALNAPPGMDHYPTGTEQLVGRFENVARIPDIIWRSMTLGSDSMLKQTQDLAEHVLTPPVKDYASFDFRALKQIADKAYHYTLERQDALHSLLVNVNTRAN